MKKVARLRAKKAFTLVELVVVIAIIGILSAILIPVMVGVVRDADVASANTSANDVRKQINIWITKMDAEGHFVNKSSNTDNEPSVRITAEGKAYTPVFSENFWAYEEDDAEMRKSLSDHLVSNLGYRELFAIGYIDNGTVAALCYCVSTEEATTDLPEFSDFSRSDYWKSTNGVAEDGTIIGTSPQIING